MVSRGRLPPYVASHSCSAYHLAFAVLGLLSLLFTVTAKAVIVRNAEEFVRACEDPLVAEIYIGVSFLSVEFDSWPAEPVRVSRSVTVAGSAAYPVLDFNLVPGKLQLEEPHQVTFTHLELRNTKLSASRLLLGIFRPSLGSTVVLDDVKRHEPLCLDQTAQIADVLFTSRPRGYPGEQKVHAAPCPISPAPERRTHSQGVVFRDVAVPIPITLDDVMLGGGYTLVLRDTAHLCHSYVNASDLGSGTYAPGRCSSRLDFCMYSLPGVLGWCLHALLMLYAWRRVRRASQSRGRDPATGLGPRLTHMKPPAGFPHEAMRDGSDVAVEDTDAIPAATLSGDASTSGCLYDSCNPNVSAVPPLTALEPACPAHRMPALSTPEPLVLPGGKDSLPSLQTSLTLGKPIGSGSFGRVYQGRWQGALVAVKIIPQPIGTTAGLNAPELELSLAFRHPNVVRTLHYYTTTGSPALPNAGSVESLDTLPSTSPHGPLSEAPGRPLGKGNPPEESGAVPSPEGGPPGALAQLCQHWVIQELCDEGPLSVALYRRRFAINGMGGPADMHAVLLRARDIAHGVQYLHSLKVCHGDLKSQNVLLCYDADDPFHCTAKVADFGLSQTLAEGEEYLTTSRYGTVTHMAPELLQHGRMRPACDTFSFAIILWELVTGGVAHAGLRPAQVLTRVVLEGLRPQLPHHVAPEYCQLVTDCWHSDPEQRPSFAEVIARLDDMLARHAELQQYTTDSLSSITAFLGTMM